MYEICGDCCEGGVDDEGYEEHEGREARNCYNRQGEGCVELQLCLSMMFTFRCDLKIKYSNEQNLHRLGENAQIRGKCENDHLKEKKKNLKTSFRRLLLLRLLSRLLLNKQILSIFYFYLLKQAEVLVLM